MSEYINIVQDLKDKIGTEEEYLAVIKTISPSNEHYDAYQTKILETDEKLLLLKTLLEGGKQLQTQRDALLEACKDLLTTDLYADGEGIVSFDYPNTSDGDEAKAKAYAAIALTERKA